MRKAAISLLAALIALPAVAATPSRLKPPVLVEVYTAQGCSSCRPADTLAATLADKPGVLPLTFSVDYWDYLGWPDTFAKPEFAERQRAYAQKFTQQVYTPQVVIDGKAEVSAAKPDAVDRMIAAEVKRIRYPPQMALRNGGDRLLVGSGPTPMGGADVWLIRYDPQPREVTVRAGESRGQTVTARNVVREIVRLGVWGGVPRAYKLPPPSGEEKLASLAVVQGVKGGPIVGVIDLPEPAEPKAAD